MSLFIDDPQRRIRPYFTEVNAAGDRFHKTNKPTQKSFERLFNSAAFILDRSDRAKEYTTLSDEQTEKGIQGLVVLARATDAKNRTEPVDINNSIEKLSYSYATRPVHLPEVVGFNPDVVNIPNVILGFPNQEETIVIEQDNITNANHTVWKPKLSYKTLNFLSQSFTDIGNFLGVLDVRTIAQGAAIATKANQSDLVITNTIVSNKVDKSDWITQSDPERLRIYDDAPAEVFSVIANYGTPTPTASGSFVYCRYKITDKVCHLYWMITIKVIDFANANLKLYRFNFKILGKQTNSIPARSVGYMKGIVYNAQPTLPIPPVIPSLQVSPSDEGCIIEAVNNGADIDINMYKYDRFGDADPNNPNGINSMSSAYDIQLFGEIFFEIN